MTKKQRIEHECLRLWFGKLLKDVCEACGGLAVQVHHFFPRSSYAHLKFDLDNGVSVCQGCHFKIHRGDPVPGEAIKKNRGLKWYKALEAKARARPKPSYKTLSYLEAIREQLKNL